MLSTESSGVAPLPSHDLFAGFTWAYPPTNPTRPPLYEASRKRSGQQLALRVAGAKPDFHISHQSLGKGSQGNLIWPTTIRGHWVLQRPLGKTWLLLFRLWWLAEAVQTFRGWRQTEIPAESHFKNSEKRVRRGVY